ncbi:MAG TPA: His/Gly/Thr/Pro-type tRNA ligase C-terminal domain-containing protein, partial [Sedimentisphaerales bacterium]|nr:His/Gly/Thr/Pro-type tRNA ligase C-terminal domain-containing protein [Sedimentisphaerales bacterium]
RAHADRLAYMLVVGPKEAEVEAINVRIRGVNEQRTIGIGEFLSAAARKIAEKEIDLAIVG